MYEVWTVPAQVGKYMCVHLLMMCICHCVGSIPDHPTSFKLTWDLEIGVSPKSVLCNLLAVPLCYVRCNDTHVQVPESVCYISWHHFTASVTPSTRWHGILPAARCLTAVYCPLSPLPAHSGSLEGLPLHNPVNSSIVFGFKFLVDMVDMLLFKVQ